MWVILIFFVDILITTCVFTPTLRSVTCTTWQSGYKRRQLMLNNWLIYWRVHFRDINPNSYDMNNIKFDMNVSKVRFIAKDQFL